MKKMHTLTIGGETYAVYDPEAAHIDDANVGDSAWSSRQIVERLCPVLTDRGEAPVCRPVAGYPLEVVSHISPVQAENATPQSPCPITGHTAVELTLSNGEETGEFTENLGQTAYCGLYDWSTGKLTLTHKLLTLTGNEAASYWKVSGTDIYTTALISDHDKSSQVMRNAWCSHAPLKTDNSGVYVDSSYITHANASIGGISFNRVVANWGYPEVSVDAHLAFLKAQYEAGTPVQLLYKLREPVLVALSDVMAWERQSILPLSGINTLQSSSGDTAVTYRADLSAVWEKLLGNTGIE